MNKHISDLIELGEGYHAEFKESLDKTFAEEVCAFANAKGGKVFLGVTNSGDIKGIDTGNNFRSQVQDYIRQLQPSLSVDIEVEGKIIVVHVPEGSDKPYGCLHGFFMRVGPNTQKLTRNEIIGFFKKEGRIRFETLINDKADFERDFDPKAFDLFVQKAGISPTIKKEFLLRNLDCLKALSEKVRSVSDTPVFLLRHSIELSLTKLQIKCQVRKMKKLPIKLQERNYRKETTRKLLYLIKNHPSIKIPDLAISLGLTQDGVNYHLRTLKKKNIIRRIGGRKQGYWEIIEND